MSENLLVVCNPCHKKIHKHGVGKSTEENSYKKALYLFSKKIPITAGDWRSIFLTESGLKTLHKLAKLGLIEEKMVCEWYVFYPKDVIKT